MHNTMHDIVSSKLNKNETNYEFYDFNLLMTLITLILYIPAHTCAFGVLICITVASYTDLLGTLYLKSISMFLQLPKQFFLPLT